MGKPTADGRNREPSERAHVCVVGSGPAGSLIAYKLAQRGHDVVVLEAGKWFDRSDRQNQMERYLRPAHSLVSIWDMDGEENAYRSTGNTLYQLNEQRVKGVGGSTLHWGGTVARLSPVDFEMNSRWGIASDWPIDYETLREYYAEAEAELGVAGTEDNPYGPPRDEPYPMEGFPRSYSDRLWETACEEVGIETHTLPSARNSGSYEGRSPCVGYGTCHPVCPSGAKYSADVHAEKAVDQGARIIDRATVQRLEHDDSGRRITGAVYRTPDGSTHRQEAEQFVLATGAIENPRLLLLSASETHPDGLANSSGLVGKYLMDNPYFGIVGELDVPTEQNQIGFATMESMAFYEPDDVPPGSFRLAFQNAAGPRIVELAVEQRKPIETLRNAVIEPGVDVVAELRKDTSPIEWGDELLESISERYGNHFRVLASSGHLPYEENQVRLSDEETDAFGNPVPEIDWGHRGEYERKTEERAFEVLEEIVDAVDAEVLWRERTEWYGGVAHPSGTTRMGDDPDESVVTSNLRAHDLENLFVCGSSTFVTLPAHHPTLTIAALALRLADHLDTITPSGSRARR